MASYTYITPITDRTYDDVVEARINQADLTTHNKGAWNYSDVNRVCNNIAYAAEWMYEQGFFPEPYSVTVKTNWTETDIITYETLNSMIVANINNLKSYSRSDLTWYPISSIVNMDYNVANWIELNIDALATQEPLPEDTFELVVENGSGSGYYEAYTEITIVANSPETDLIFSYWSGDHLDNVASPTSSVTTFTMPYDDTTLTANYAGTVEHTLTVITNSGTETAELLYGDTYSLVADPAPTGKTFYAWTITPEDYESNLYEPAASTTFTMPNEAVTIKAVYITPGEKELIVINGSGSGFYEYNEEVSISPDIPSGSTFTNWYGDDTQYLLYDTTQESNRVLIPDQTTITITAKYYTPTTYATDIEITVLGGYIYSVNGITYDDDITSGSYTQGDQLVLISETPETDDVVFDYWSVYEGDNLITNSNRTYDPVTITVGTKATEIDGNYRNLEYHNYTLNTYSGTTIETKEWYDVITANASPYPSGQTFYRWTGDTASGSTNLTTLSFNTARSSTSTYMGHSDREITATYRDIVTGVILTVVQPSGETAYIYPEFTTLTITADSPGENQGFYGWSLVAAGTSFSGFGSLSSTSNSTTVYTFGQDEAILTSTYHNHWKVTMVDGYLWYKASKHTSYTGWEDWSYSIQCRDLAIYEYFVSWSVSGAGTVANELAAKTSFTIGEGVATVTANIANYPDKTLTVYFQDPDTNEVTLISQETYTYGTKIVVQAPNAPTSTTFLSWLGDVVMLSPNALASSATITHLTQDTTITATYYYPEATGTYVLTVYNGTPSSGNYAAGKEIKITANEPAEGWEFYKWSGDTAYLENDVTSSTNTLLMPKQAVTLYANYKVEGEDPIYRIVVSGGTAHHDTYTDSTGEEHEEEDSSILDVIPGIQITLTADKDTDDYVFDYWSGNFVAAGVTDITLTINPTYFTMPEADLNIVMYRRPRDQYTVYTTNATGPGTAYAGTYGISGNLEDTDYYHYKWGYWTCVDADGTDYSSAIEDSTAESTNITITDRSLWVEAHYTTYYKLTVVNGQDTGSGYYYEGETVNSVYANDASDVYSIFGEWNDPVGVISGSIYDSSPTITMKDSIATITAVYASIEGTGNSIAITTDDIDEGIISKAGSSLLNGVFTTGTIVLDYDGCIGIITSADTDNDSYTVLKLFYGGNS